MRTSRLHGQYLGWRQRQSHKRLIQHQVSCSVGNEEGWALDLLNTYVGHAMDYARYVSCN